MHSWVNKMNKAFCRLFRFVDNISEVLRHIKIPTRLIISYVAVSVVPVIVIGSFSSYIAQKSVLEKMNASAAQITDSINNDTKRYLEDLLDISNSIIYSDYIQKFLTEYSQNPEDKNAPQGIVNYIKNNVSLSYLSDIRIIMENGDLIHYKPVYRLRSEEMEKLKNIVAQNDGLPVFVPVQLESNNRGVSLVRAVYSSVNLQKLGEIYITVTEKSLKDIYSSIDMGKGSEIYLMNSSGEMVYSNAKDTTFDAKKLLKEIESVESDDIWSFDFKTKSEKYAVTYSKMDNVDWYIVSLVPYSYLNSTVNKLKIYIYICVVICLLACSSFTIVINRSISIPLTNLRNHMINAGNSNLLGKVSDHCHDEITDVAKSFNSMIDEINGLIEDVHTSEQQKSAEKLKALQAQINPHFLSNTLNTLKWMAAMQNADNIENLTTSLIQLLQVSMGKVEDLVPLSKEIEYIRNYVEIQSFKYWDKFTVEYDIDEEAGDCLLPPFSIQPIVENAIIHGIEPKAGKGVIWISASRIGDDIVCVVKDNGIGFSSDKSLDEVGRVTPKHISGIGMNNVDERIKMFFGENYGVTYESIPGIYTKVKVIVPYTKNKDNKAAISMV